MFWEWGEDFQSGYILFIFRVVHQDMNLTGASCKHRHARGARCVSVLLAGIGVLGLVKTADAVTTILGLTQIPGAVEQNPLIATAIDVFGLVPGLILVILGSVILVTLVTEFFGQVAAGPADRGETVRLIRIVGFGGAIFTSLIPVVLNARILINHGIFF